MHRTAGRERKAAKENGQCLENQIVRFWSSLERLQDGNRFFRDVLASLQRKRRRQLQLPV